MLKSRDIRKKILSFINPFILIAIAIVVVMSVVILRTGIFAGLITSSSEGWVIAALAFLPLLLLCTIIYASIRYNSIVAVLYTISVVWFPAILYLFLGTIVFAIIYLGGMYFNYPVDPKMLGWGIIGLVGIMVVYGIVNAENVRITEYAIESPELTKKWAGKKIAIISDVHLGVVRRGHFTKRISAMINELKPDMVIIAGDIIDGPVFDYEKGLAPLKKITPPDGLIYAQGNHEGYNWEPEKFYPVIEKLTTTLIDKTILVDGVQVVGLAYAHESKEETKKRLYTAGYNPELPSLVILHDPTNTQALQNEGASLVISGHTHKGQFFPFNLFMKPIYKEFAYGKNVKGKTTSITTSGIGTMMPPLRLGSNPEIVVLTFK
jgi:predicted MPP superfamily phosphohydrolase